MTRAATAPSGEKARRLETAGKPIAVAVAGLALGGGCEFALAAHHRVIADHPQATFGLPESLVGLLPGGGGTQRLPRLLGIEAALPVLLDGARPHECDRTFRRPLTDQVQGRMVRVQFT